ncbi:MAG: hypothetical protein MJA82_06260 [Clostridia bacterium]|nr:hypothetical protein [Clostridia bacterium]
MSLKIEHITKIDIWDKNYCPVCGRKEFVSIHHASVWCNECNAEFSIRHTAGDPGYVIDCYVKFVDNLYISINQYKAYRDIIQESLLDKEHLWLVDKESDYTSGWLYYKKDGGVKELNTSKKEILAIDPIRCRVST